MTYSEALAYIEQLKPAGMQMGLERMERAMSALSHPEKCIRAVHLAGSSGKGSTAHMLAAMLSAGGYRTGLFTSPAVTDIRDTIQINGRPIDQTAFAACAQRVRCAVPQGLSEFEFLTALALCYFEQCAVDIAVIECGLGGETDATNIIPAPLCAVLTPIALDHTAWLGDTVRAIAKQKSGIAKPPCDIVCAPKMDEEALEVIFERAAANGQTVHMPCVDNRASCDKHGTHFTYRGRTVTLALIGEHQQCNAATALCALDVLRSKGFFVEESQAIAALSTVRLPCRLEMFAHQPSLLLDGAHNPQKIHALCQAIDILFDTPITLVIGMLADKDVEACLQALAPRCQQIICCTPQGTPRAMSARALASIARKHHPCVCAIDDPVSAYEAAKALQAARPIVVSGSFYTAATVRRAL